MSGKKHRNIHWYPGHMAKAMRELQKKISFVDIIVELADARLAFRSRNKQLIKLGDNNKRLLIFTKVDLADQSELAKWLNYYESIGESVLALNLLDKSAPQQILTQVKELGKDKWEKDKRRGLKPQPIRALVTGIPNVGKSTLINRLRGSRSAKVANRPGLTRAQQFIKISAELELIDTPGVLPPNYDDKSATLKLAMIGTIPLEILPLHEISNATLDLVKTSNLSELNKRYNIEVSADSENYEILKLISNSRGIVGGEDNDYEQAAKILQKEFMGGLLGLYTLESVDALK